MEVMEYEQKARRHIVLPAQAPDKIASVVCLEINDAVPKVAQKSPLIENPKQP